MNPSDSTAFWQKAYAAINEGLITREEALFIVRVRSRKQNYWGKHICCLDAILAERREEKEKGHERPDQ